MEYKLHECKSISEGVRVVYSNSFHEEEIKCWSLVIQKEATEEDLEENHYLEEIGETIWEASIEILACPFCGKKLAAKFLNGGKFRCKDYSCWNARKM